MVCEHNQMALGMVMGGIERTECLNLPSSADGRGLMNWALSRIIGSWHSSNATVSDVELGILERGEFKRPGGALITFALPKQIKTAVARLRSKSNPPARSKQYRRKLLI